ncbi:hypothetical protein RRG08_032501 [Elysia crispata]|uniref:Uncharacterized protein n=1 Tax=Elysia crispata TaxID=231223 RepID=A0AAE0ZY32_9GAST|nr:hypothetical protein RRG08_032501 [Elysia crispata]
MLPAPTSSRLALYPVIMSLEQIAVTSARNQQAKIRNVIISSNWSKKPLPGRRNHSDFLDTIKARHSAFPAEVVNTMSPLLFGKINAHKQKRLVLSSTKISLESSYQCRILL